MKVPVKGTELWTVQDIIESNLRDSETFSITVGEMRKLHQRHCNVLMDLHQLKVAHEVLKEQLNTQKRFIVHA